LSRLAEAGLDVASGPELPERGPLLAPARALEFLNLWIVRLGSIALLAAALVLTYSVASRYFFKAATDWQDEAAVFCLVGAVFTASAYVQSFRGHIGIELLAASWTSPRSSSAPSSRGNRGRCGTRPGWTSRRPPRRGRRRCRSRTSSWRSA
jgi:hypothetical protein